MGSVRGFISLLLIVLAGTCLLAYLYLRQSLPLLDAALEVNGVVDTVTIARDQQGIVEISAQTRGDIAFGLGFAHAQDRFFQMDLQRRNSAGELSELLGAAAASYDKRVRLHRFRARATRNFASMTVSEQQLLQAYSDGVNAGLNALAAPPFEYTLLLQTPRQWQPEDSLLTVASMILVLQDDEALFERTRGQMAEALPKDLYDFFSQQGGEWDAPLTSDVAIGDTLPAAPMPTTGWRDLFAADTAMQYSAMQSEDPIIGSNNWAVAGQLTQHGGAIVADDMHLAIRVPNIWYRAQWRHPQTGRLISGASLPGTPTIVAGSNGKLAWGFTNTQGDWSDVIQLETDASKQKYKTAQGWQEFTLYDEIIAVKDGESQSLQIKETQWGPVIAVDAQGRELALRWTAHDNDGINMGAMLLETANSVAEAIELGPRIGIPHQNLTLGDDSGAIGWTVAGPFPKRIGTDGKLPESWSDGTKFWGGYRGLDQHPKLYNPSHGRIWTANARTLSGDQFEMMGDSAYALGARQQQIRDDLFARDRFTEQDQLDIQLDDRAVFLQRWQQRLLGVLKTTAAQKQPALQSALKEVENWGQRADVSSVGYRLTQAFRLKVIEFITAPLETYMLATDPEFNYANANRQVEYPAWELLTQRPMHLLNPDFNSWDELELLAIKSVVDPLYTDSNLADNTWGEFNRAKIQHPMARFVKPIEWWLSMPATQLNGDTHMPRVQTPTHGASERFAVSPGKEDLAYFHMATGQSAHPLSPYFDKGHSDWVEGNASAWLKGETAHRVILKPKRVDSN